MSFQALTPPDAPEQDPGTAEAQLHVMELSGGATALLAIDRQTFWRLMRREVLMGVPGFRVELGEDEHAGTMRIKFDPTGPHRPELNNRSLVFKLGVVERLAHLTGTRACLCASGDGGEVLIQLPPE